ncbi:TetR family transcriptional regulator [Flavobacterium capsici]|uniref:TetR family transcriptional regulator n=1 Tax=Flavobacterium capsici TaxID=3075618 RepID=A0AA96ESG9_9FLAO|nr:MULTISPECIES: TetR family transcriptional regulator [unclassified Flavobacterium]WNM17809.1 TetR family transcriptional regulator [Flavobacterium sp. PMR2A8]WNM21862.1 TetR family transcriptional regulator [Flavobacterium sp. PMTSA4]
MTDFNEKQIEILQVAEQLFAEKGFDGTSVRDIAKIANINVAMISYYFGSKEKLLEALVLYRISSFKLELENLNQENISPIQKMEKLIEFYIKRINKNKCIYQILHFEISSKKRDIDLATFTKAKNENLRLIENIVKEGQQQGLFQKNINVPLLPTIIMGSYLQFQMNAVYYKELLGLHSEAAFENYVLNDLTLHIQKTIKALLVYEN